MTCKSLRSASSRNVSWSSSGLLPYKRTLEEPHSTTGEASFILPFHGDSFLKARGIHVPDFRNIWEHFQCRGSNEKIHGPLTSWCNMIYRRWTRLETLKQSSFNTADQKGGPTTIGVSLVVAKAGVEQKVRANCKGHLLNAKMQVRHSKGIHNA